MNKHDNQLLRPDPQKYVPYLVKKEEIIVNL